MALLALTGASIYSPFQLFEDGIILIRDAKIEFVGTTADIKIPVEYRRVPLDGLMITPGFIDLHFSGDRDVSANDGDVENLLSWARFQAVHGVTSFLATWDASFSQLMTIAQSFTALSRSDYKGARCLGIHLAQPLSACKTTSNLVYPSNGSFLSIEEIIKLHQISGKGIKLLSIDPELEGALNLAESLRKEGIVFSITHSNAPYELVLKAIKAGFSGITHCLQDRWLLEPKEPGVIGAALTLPELTVEVIGDINLLHPAVMNLLWQTKGPGGLILTSNLITQPDMQNQQDSIREGTSPAILTVKEALANFLKATNCKITEGLRLVTYNPAKFLGINKKKGSLYPGKDADLVVLTSDFEAVMTMVEGEVISGLISL